jgi:putative ABC transport system permease protein
MERFLLTARLELLTEEKTMDALVHDLRYGLRLLAKSPAFTAAAVVTLALGIGANAAIFSLADALLWKSLPAVDMDGRAAVYTSERGGAPAVSSFMDYLDFRQQSTAFADLAAFKPRLVDLAGGGTTERVEGMMVTASYFPVLGVEPAAGRFFLPEEDRVPGAEAVAVISHGLWQSRFGGDPGIVGRTVVVNGRDFAVVGVAPPGFHGTRLLDRPQVFVPMMMQPHLMPASGNLLDHRGWGSPVRAKPRTRSSIISTRRSPASASAR